MKVLIDLSVHTPGPTGKYVCLQKECDMPTVFVGMELWSKTYGVGFPFTNVVFRPSVEVIEAWVSDKCSTDEELTESVNGWLDDGFVITGNER